MNDPRSVYSESVAEIFRIRSNDRIKTMVTNDHRVSDLFFSFPELDAVKIAAIQSRVKKPGKRVIHEVVLSLKMDYKYEQENLELALSSLEDAPELAVSVIIHQIFAALFIDQIEFSEDNYLLVVRSLTKILTEWPEETREVLSNFMNCITFLFTYAWAKMWDINFGRFNMTRDGVIATMDHIVVNNTIQNIEYLRLVLFLKQVTYEFDELTNRVVALLALLFKEQRMLILMNDHKGVIDIIRPLCNTLNIDVIKICCVLSLVCPNQVIKEYIAKVPCLLVNEFKARQRPIITLREENRTPRMMTAVLDFDYEPVETQSTFPTGFEMVADQKQHFNILKNTSDYVTEVVETIVEMISFLDESIVQIFIANFANEIQNLNDSEHFYDVMHVFFVCLGNVRNNQIIEKLKDAVLMPRLYNPAHTIFDENPLPEEIRQLRAIGCKVFSSFPLIMDEFLLRQKDYPFFFVELMFYIDNFDVIYNRMHLNALINCCIVLQKFDIEKHTEQIEAVRSCAFVLLWKLFLKTRTAYQDFESVMRFSYEMRIRPYFIYLFRQSLNTNKDCFDLRSMFTFFNNVLEKGEYEYAWKMCEIAAKLFEKRDYLVTQFDDFFDIITKLLYAYPRQEVLQYALTMIPKVSRIRGTHLKCFEKGIRANESPELFQTLLWYLGRPEFLPRKQRGFLILEPRYLLLFTFGYGLRLKVMRTFEDLAAFSGQNARDMSHSGIGEVIVDLLNDKKIVFDGVEFDIYLYDKLDAVELLNVLCYADMPYSIVHKMLESVETMKLFLHILLQTSCVPHKVSIGTFPALMQTKMEHSHFSGSFTITFWLKLDEYVMQDDKRGMRIMSVTDSSGTMFGIDMTRLSMCTFIQSAQRRIEVTVNPNMFFDGTWCHYTILFDNMEDPFKVDTYQNISRLNGSEFTPVRLQPGPLTLDIGGSYQNTGKVYGYIAGLSIYDRLLTREEIDDLCVNITRPIKDDYVISMWNSDNWQTRETAIVSETPMFLISNNLFISKMLRKMHNTRDMVASNLILEYFSLISDKFELDIAPFLEFLMFERNFGDKNMFKSIWNIFSVMKSGQRKSEWFLKIIINVDIWIRYCNFRDIVLFWSNRILEFSEYFKSVTQFAAFVAHFKHISTEDIMVFADFTALVGKFGLPYDTVEVILSGMRTENVNTRSKAYLRLLKALSYDIVEQKFNVRPLVIHLTSYLGLYDPELIVDALLIIHDFSRNNECYFPNYALELIILTNRKCIPRIVELMGPLIESYKDSFAILCLMSLISKVRIPLELLTGLEIQNSEYGEWYFFPMMLAFNSNDEDHKLLIEFVAKNVKTQKDLVCVMLLHSYFTAIFGSKSYDSLTRILSVANTITGDGPEWLYCIFLLVCYSILFRTRVDKTVTEVRSLEDVTDIIINPGIFDAEYSWSRFDLETDKCLDGVQMEFLYSQERIDLASMVVQNLGSNYSAQTRDLSKLLWHIFSRAAPKEIKDFSRTCDILINFYSQFQSALIDTLPRIFKSVYGHFQALKCDEKTHRRSSSMAPQIDIISRSVNYRQKNTLNKFFIPGMISKSITPAKIRKYLNDSNCTLVKYKQRISALLSVETEEITIKTPEKTISLPRCNIQYVLFRCQNACEILCLNGKSYLLVDIDDPEATNELYHMDYITNAKDEIQYWVNAWKDRRISNFAFICHIGILTGRTPNDEVCFPIMPQLITNWSNATECGISSGRVTPKRLKSFCFDTEPFSDFKDSRERSFANQTPTHVVSLEQSVPLDSIPECEPHERTDTTLKSALERSVVSACLLTLPECIGDKEALPEFCSNKFDFIYKHRKILEASDNVRNWVSHVFNVAVTSRPPYIGPSEIICQSKNIKAALPIYGECPSFIVIDGDGNFHKNDFTWNGYPDAEIILGHNGIAVYSKKSHTIKAVTKSLRFCLTDVFLENPIIAVDENCVIFTRTSSIVCTFGKFSNDKERPLCLLKSRARKIATNERYNILVIACDDRKVRIRNLNSGNKISTFNVNEDLKEILITEELGFIILITYTRIILLSTNGLYIKSIKYNINDIKHWWTFSARGLDYVVVVLSNERMRYFEAFYPEYMFAMPDVTCPVGVIYDGCSDDVVILQNNGEFVRPLKLPHTMDLHYC